MASRPAIRLRPAPPLEPPFDDELTPQTWAMAGAEQLALDWLPIGATARGRDSCAPTDVVGAAPGARMVGLANAARVGVANRLGGTAALGGTDGRGSAVGIDVATPGAGPGGLRGGPSEAGAIAGASPESRAAARRFAAMCLEILNGYRPTGHVRPLAIPAEAPFIIEQLTLARARVADAHRIADRGPGRAIALHRRAPGATEMEPGAPVALRPISPARGQPQLIGLGPVRVCEPRTGAAEVAAVLRTAGRAWALAFRLEKRQVAWLCTAARML